MFKYELKKKKRCLNTQLGQSNFGTLVPEATCTSLKKAARNGPERVAKFSYLGVVLGETLS